MFVGSKGVRGGCASNMDNLNISEQVWKTKAAILVF